MVPDWSAILATNHQLWQDARERSVHGRRILIATSTGGHRAVTPLESLLAVALTLRGAEVHFLLCDRLLPACLQATGDLFNPPSTFLTTELRQERICAHCIGTGRAVYERTGLPIHYFSEFVTEEDKRHASEISQATPFHDIPEYGFEGVPVGDHAKAGAMRYFGKGFLSTDPHEETVLRRYLEAAILSAMVTKALLDKYNFDTALFHHGIYVPQGIIGAVARQRNLRVINWNVAYRKQCFVFSHEDSYHFKMLDEPTSLWENMPWSETHNKVILDYLRSRWEGSNDWIKYFDEPETDTASILEALRVDPTKPCISMLTNVTWDAQLFYVSNAFASILDWVFDTIEYFKGRPDIQLVIRIHPAEVRGTMKTNQPMLDEIMRAFPELPDNVFVVPPESQLSTYALAILSDCALVYGTKTGVELAAAGIPVIVAGEAWIRNKGISLDASSKQRYIEILDRLPLGKRLDPVTLDRARKYAFHFFYRRMIPLNRCVEQIEGGAFPFYRVTPAPLETLGPGYDEGLDVICDGVLTGTPFIYPAENHVSSDQNPSNSVGTCAPASVSD